jgi:hypothetical protein
LSSRNVFVDLLHVFAGFFSRVGVDAIVYLLDVGSVFAAFVAENRVATSEFEGEVAEEELPDGRAKDGGSAVPSEVS